MKKIKYTVMIDGDACELDIDAVDPDDARAQYMAAIGKRLVIWKTKDFLAGKPAITMSGLLGDQKAFPPVKPRKSTLAPHFLTDEAVIEMLEEDVARLTPTSTEYISKDTHLIEEALTKVLEFSPRPGNQPLQGIIDGLRDFLKMNVKKSPSIPDKRDGNDA